MSRAPNRQMRWLVFSRKLQDCDHTCKCGGKWSKSFGSSGTKPQAPDSANGSGSQSDGNHKSYLAAAKRAIKNVPPDLASQFSTIIENHDCEPKLPLPTFSPSKGGVQASARLAESETTLKDAINHETCFVKQVSQVKDKVVEAGSAVADAQIQLATANVIMKKANSATDEPQTRERKPARRRRTSSMSCSCFPAGELDDLAEDACNAWQVMCKQQRGGLDDFKCQKKLLLKQIKQARTSLIEAPARADPEGPHQPHRNHAHSLVGEAPQGRRLCPTPSPRRRSSGLSASPGHARS